MSIIFRIKSGMTVPGQKTPRTLLG